jgi:hypothetical protein
MRFKIADRWVSVEPGQPLLVELDQADKANIANMAEGASCYAAFHSGDTTTAEQKLAWMAEGREQ